MTNGNGLTPEQEKKLLDDSIAQINAFMEMDRNRRLDEMWGMRRRRLFTIIEPYDTRVGDGLIEIKRPYDFSKKIINENDLAALMALINQDKQEGKEKEGGDDDGEKGG